MTAAASMRIDLLDPATFAAGHPHDLYRHLREHDPVHFHEEPGGRGFWVLTRYADIRTVGRDPQRFSSSPTIMIGDSVSADPDHQMMLMMDPPKHGGHRRLLIPDFVPRAVHEMLPRIAELATRIVDAVCERGECDLVEDLAGEMPSFVVAELLGLPLDDGRELYRLTETIHAAPSSVPEGAGAAAVMSMFQYAGGVWEDRRRTPRDDLSTRLAHAVVDGRPFDPIDFGLMFLLLVDAGGDTTRNLVAGGYDALFAHPDQYDRFRADVDGLMPTAMEELLRWVSPVTYMRRTATVDTSIGGQAIAAGDKVVMYYGRRIGTRRSSPSPTCSTSAGRRTSTWPSAAADRTSAWARTWPGPRPGHSCASCSAASPTSSRRDPPRGCRRPSSADPSTCRSGSHPPPGGGDRGRSRTGRAEAPPANRRSAGGAGLGGRLVSRRAC